eukprot:PITA_20576
MRVVHRDVNFSEVKAMICSLERGLQIHAVEDILAPNEKPEDDVEHPHAEEQGVETSTYANTSKDGRKCTREADRKSVWEVVPRLVYMSVVSSRWIYKVKQATDGSVEKHKARLLAKGFSLVERIDYDDNFSPVARYSSIISILEISVQMEWRIHEMDVNTTFLNDIIEEAVYIE